MRDPRDYQIGSLTLLLLYGLTVLRFDLAPLYCLAVIAAALATQWLCTRVANLPRFDPKSALISALSLCLLLRTDFVALGLLAAIIAIASKFIVRWNGKHIFNPTNGAIVAMLLLSDRAWVSPAQWGSVAFFGFLLLCLGGAVVHRALRSDVTYAFLLFYGAIVIGRSVWLGEPMTIPIHRLESGSLLIFSFFMISDPKTTPSSRVARILFALAVALGGGYVQFKLFRTNGLLWSLALFSMFVPLLDRLFRGERYEWSRVAARPLAWRIPMKRIAAMLSIVALAITPETALAFCGFYVAKADTKLFNRASQVAIVRDGDRTVMTMANDFKGNLKEFAVVIPVPAVLKKNQIHVGDKALLDHLDAFSAPRLVEYHDGNPCWIGMMERSAGIAAPAVKMSAQDAARTRSLGVTIEAQYTVGEYDILILSAKESDGLETWLKESGYRMPPGASKVLASYIKQKMKFFVAKVNLDEQSKLGFSYLRPIQIAYTSPKFMLPIRLGTVNANGPQELFIYALTRTGRVETTNYRTVKLPSDAEIPLFVKDEFPKFYKAMFAKQVEKHDMSTVFLEYAWDMAWCDPCAADPLSNEELRKLGVFWLGDERGQNVFLTRLHVRYDAEHFPEDLVFQETGDRTNFQGRYILRHAWKGEDENCPEAKRYRAELRKRREGEARTLASLTGWRIEEIRKKMRLPGGGNDEGDWWDELWE